MLRATAESPNIPGAHTRKVNTTSLLQGLVRGIKRFLEGPRCDVHDTPLRCLAYYPTDDYICDICAQAQEEERQARSLEALSQFAGEQGGTTLTRTAGSLTADPASTARVNVPSARSSLRS